MASGDSDAYLQEIERWREARRQRLTAPNGWVSLVGLAWLKPGNNRVGSASDNDIVLAKAPAHLGTVTWSANGTVSVVLEKEVGATIDGASRTEAAMLDDSHQEPTVVAFGTVNFILIDREGRKALRVRDSEAPTRVNFPGLDYFDVDPAWRIVADWQPLDPPFQLATGTVIGTIENYQAPGMAIFHHAGERFTLYPVLETPDATQLFVIFADLTSGKETHGAARFLYADMPREGKLVLDFNKAYNPPCAFTPYATCPLAPPENRLVVRVTAGERKFEAGHQA
ncbi:MAG TPA: DUF1684 domain-containing protein [Rhodanobacteraceae bacterium]